MGNYRVANAESICKHPCPVRTGSMFDFAPAPVGTGGYVSHCEAVSLLIVAASLPARDISRFASADDRIVLSRNALSSTFQMHFYSPLRHNI